MSDENLRTVYEQYWLHARHQETQRLWFTNIYALIVTGALAYFGLLKGDDPVRVILLVFLILLSLFGYFMIYAWNRAFTMYSRQAELISITEWHIAEDFQRFTKYGKRVRAGTLFAGFYSLMLGVFVALLVYQTVKATIWITALAWTIVFGGSYLLYHLYLDKQGISKIQEDFEHKVRKYSDKKQ